MTVESVLIVFSVLLALSLDSCWTQRAEKAATRDQLASIHSELEDNAEILAEWSERHGSILENVTTLRKSDDPGRLVVDHRLQLERVLGKSLAEQMVRDTAWETAKATGLVRHFDLQCANFLTDIYGLQSIVKEQIWEIAELLGERETHEAENVLQTLVLLEIHLQELRGQERFLADAYDEALAVFDSADGCI